MLVPLVLMAHACLLAVMGLCQRFMHARFDGALWIVAAIVPVAGPVSALALWGAERSRRAGGRESIFDQTRPPEPTDDPLADPDSAKEVVPLEDAMLVSNASSRRNLVLDVLLQGGQDYGPSLVMARSSNDPEVAHYASSATMQISASFEEALAREGLAYQQNPYDPEVVRRYLGVLERYLDSGLAEGDERRIQETRYREVLERKVRIDPEEVDLLRLADSQLKEGLYEDADHTIWMLEVSFPEDDDVWILRLRYLYGLGRADDIREMVKAKAAAHPSARIRAITDFWEKVQG